MKSPLALALIAPLTLCTLPCRSLAQDAPAAKHPPAVIVGEVILAELHGNVDLDKDVSAAQLKTQIEQLADHGELISLSKARLTTVDGQEALFQLGQQVAIVTGRTIGGRSFSSVRGGTPSTGRSGSTPTFRPPTANMYSRMNVGTIINFRPQITDDGSLLVHLTLEKSQLQPVSAPPSDNVLDVEPPDIVTLNSQSTVRIADGETLKINSYHKVSGDSEKTTVILLTARIANP